MSVIFSQDQSQAAEGAIDAFRRRLAGGEPLVLAGSAGTGKTQVLAHVYERTALATVLTPTNKAAFVLRSRGVPATTIHSKIYSPAEIALKEDLEAVMGALENAPDEKKPELEAEARALEERLEKAPHAARTAFTFREDNDLAGRVVIVDEASMVGRRVLDDILRSRPKHVLLVGDPSQLMPVNDRSVFSGRHDWELTVNHRTDPESMAIVEVADAVRLNGAEAGLRRARDLSSADGPVVVLPAGGGRDEKLNLAGQAGSGRAIWLTWRNRTRRKINNSIRNLTRGADAGDIVPGELLVSYGKDDSGRWFNGCPANVLHVEPGDVSVLDEFTLEASSGRACRIDVDGKEHDVEISIADFTSSDPDYRPKWQYGYCLTVHKAQGSEWDTVVIADDFGKLGLEYDRWLYTAITRARKRLVWITGRI